MEEENQVIEKIVLTRAMYLNAIIAGLIVGIVMGCGIFLVTNFLILKGGEVVGPHLALLGQVFIGYKVTFLGSLVGLGYGLVTGFVIGYVIAFLYNRILALREARSR